MKNLTSISEHSDYLEKTFKFDAIKWDLHRKRVEFGKQPLELWMFVPCDKDGNVLDAFVHIVEGGFSREYQKAKERCLFEGWNLRDYHLLTIQRVKTIEELVRYKIELTPTALKTLGL